MKELLKKYLDEAKINELLNEMKENKIFLASEENLDTRYAKLKGEYDLLTTKDTESQKMIDELKKSLNGNEQLTAKITEYKNTIADLTSKLQAEQLDNAIKFELVSKGAKATDIDYLMFKLKQNNEDLKLDDKGNIKGLDDIVEGLKKNFSNNFETKNKKKVNVLDLDGGDGDEPKITKEQFDKMGYQDKLKLFNENKELYDELKGEEK